MSSEPENQEQPAQENSPEPDPQDIDPSKIDLTPVSPDGKVIKRVIKPGTGMKPRRGQKVTVNYTGFLQDGKVFDASGNRPFQFQIGKGVISGWNFALMSMKVGEKSRFIIHPDHAYGEHGAGTAIPPNASLIFEIELIRINK